MIAPGNHRPGIGFAGICFWLAVATAAAERPFSFERDTFAFANETALEFHHGHASPRHESGAQKPRRFTQHCFVMSRSIIQFRRFARFDPAAPQVDDNELTARVRKITGQPPWLPSFAERDRIVIPGYPDLRAFSAARPDILQQNIGLGWPTYFRPGNWRIVLPHGRSQQAATHAELERVMKRGECFVAYLTNFPQSLNINHGVLVYGREKTERGGAGGELRYSVYDPNHSDRPRTLIWSERDSRFVYQPDTDFVGGKVVVWHVYGALFQ
jgi:hypothetical protein